MITTTNLGKVMAGDGFIWGDIIEFYRIDCYAIASYHPWQETGQINKNETLFHCWVNGLDTNHSLHTLDAAIALCIAYKHEGANTRASGYFMKMIKE